MTKKELIELLKSVDDDAKIEVYMQGGSMPVNRIKTDTVFTPEGGVYTAIVLAYHSSGD